MNLKYTVIFNEKCIVDELQHIEKKNSLFCQRPISFSFFNRCCFIHLLNCIITVPPI